MIPLWAKIVVDERNSTVPPPPPWNDGIPTPIEDESPVPSVLDERAFMEECAERLNRFIRTYPREARHVLAAFLPYEHELATVQGYMDPSRPPGSTVAALFAGILQTQHGQGWVLTPVFEKDPEFGTIVIRLDVVRQDADDEPQE